MEEITDEFGVIYSADGKLLIHCDNEKLKQYEIKRGCKEILPDAFLACGELESIIIPDTVDDIGRSAFMNCSKLDNVHIPNSITEISESLFEGCYSLKEIIIPDSIRWIGQFAFGRCKNLKSIDIPDSVYSIHDWAFSGCEKLTSVTLPNSIVSLGSWVFENCSELTSVILSDSLTEIGHGTFQDCKKLDSIVIPDAIELINDRAFMNCVSLTSIVIPANVKAIGDEVFYGCSNLHEIKMPEVRPQIGHDAFWGCPGHAGYHFPKAEGITNKRFTDLFKNHKPLIGMIHTNHTYNCSVLDLAKKEIEIYLKYCIHPLIENYFGLAKDCEEVLAWMHEEHPNAIYGVNILGDSQEAFRLAKQYGASFVQIDSVCGHLSPSEDETYAKQLSLLRQEANVVLLGGVRFKYQPVLSGRSLEEDLLLGMERCDVIVCTGEGTGQPTPFGKVEEFKAVVKDFPVIVGAGITLDSAQETFRLGDGAIVGSWFKDGHRDTGNVREEYVERMVEILSHDNKIGCIPTLVRIKKEDIIIWFSKWAGLYLDYHAINKNQCEVTFLSRNDGSPSWLRPEEIIIVRLVRVKHYGVTLDITLPRLNSDRLLDFSCMFFPIGLFYSLSYVGSSSTGGKWDGQGTYDLFFKDRLSYPYESKLFDEMPNKVYFEGDDVVFEK